MSVNPDGNFNRPRFLSAAAAISPTTVASSSIISQHKQRNRSPESGGESDGGGLLSSARGSRGSSNEALKCEVISEEADRQSGSENSAEASPLEIFVQHFPPSDDNDGEAPRRGSGSLDPSDVLSISLPLSTSNINRSNSSLNIDPSSSPDGNSDFKQLPLDGSISLGEEVLRLHIEPQTNAGGPGNPAQRKSSFSVSCQSGIFENEGGSGSQIEHCPDPSGFDELNEAARLIGVGDEIDPEGRQEIDSEKSSTATKASDPSHNLAPFQDHTPICSTVSISTQTDFSSEKENIDPSSIRVSSLSSGTTNTNPIPSSTLPSVPTTTSSSSIPGTSSVSSNPSRLATILMWRNNRLWKSLTEEEHEENPVTLDLDPDESRLRLPDYFERWDVRVSQQNHQVRSHFIPILCQEPASCLDFLPKF